MAATRQIDVQNPHFSLPFRFGGINGAAFVNEQEKSLRQWEPRSDSFVREFPIAYDELIRKLIVSVRGEN